MEESNTDRELLDSEEASEYLKINEQTVRRLARERELPAFKVGREWRFRKKSLDDWIASREALPGHDLILVIDDDAAVRQVLMRVLRKSGYRVKTAPGGEEGLSLFGEEHPSLVFLDLMMPGMSGPEVLEDMRKIDSTVPVVILTGYPESSLMEKALSYSPVVLLSKPADADTIRRTAETYLRR